MRGWIYDTFFSPLTSPWYGRVLDKVPPRAHVLDVGIGTAHSLALSAPKVLRKGITVTGVDIDRDYLERARKNLAESGLWRNVRLRCEPIEKHRGGPYDAIYFSCSFMILPDPAGALRHAASQLAPWGKIFFTQTFYDNPVPIVEVVKPLLKNLTTIEFGKVTYPKDFLETLRKAGCKVEESHVLGREFERTYRLVVACKGKPAMMLAGGRR